MSDQIERFTPYALTEGVEASMEPHAQGDYVNYDDHAAVLSAKDARIAELEAELKAVYDAVPDGYRIGYDGPERVKMLAEGAYAMLSEKKRLEAQLAEAEALMREACRESVRSTCNEMCCGFCEVHPDFIDDPESACVVFYGPEDLEKRVVVYIVRARAARTADEAAKAGEEKLS